MEHACWSEGHPCSLPVYHCHGIVDELMSRSDIRISKKILMMMEFKVLYGQMAHHFQMMSGLLALGPLFKPDKSKNVIHTYRIHMNEHIRPGSIYIRMFTCVYIYTMCVNTRIH